MQYQFKIGDIVELSDLVKDRTDLGMQRPLTGEIWKLTTCEIWKLTTWSNEPAYYVEYRKSGNIEKPECSGLFLEYEIQKVKEIKKEKHTPIGRRYQKTIDTSGWTNEQFNTLHRGQWVSNFGGTGQFLGITPRGSVTINYKQTRDLKKQYAANQPLRKFVILHGGK